MSSATQVTQETFHMQIDVDPAMETCWGLLLNRRAMADAPQLLVQGKNSYTLGRHQDCDIKLEGDEISEQHCHITQVAAGSVDADAMQLDGEFPATSSDPVIILQNLSANGTYLNSFRLGQGNTRLLVEGDEIDCGLHRLLFHRGPGAFVEETRDEIQQALDSQWDIREDLGRGNFSEVRLAVHRETAAKRAVKIVKRNRFDAKTVEAVRSEVDILRSVQHPNIVQLHEAVETQEGWYLFMELATGGDLAHYILTHDETQHGLEEPHARRLFMQMVEAVSVLHSKDIIHRDLKPDNFLITEDAQTVKLADFGLAKVAGTDTFMTFCGTPQYLAPEVQSKGVYDTRVDLFSLGGILFFMLSGTRPMRKEIYR
ncbi:hypothetical protein HKX48_002579 [Thoreauomyces humboldtii]|nr:hypothetical protein HKX48_002579 [Thoreauomyces humboldtii]